ncbi:ankyrin repeat domain-containing protein [Sansalvadorimonas verongulae]|uniref:ankyrin repeat domain-containing protein n=1 Tax=Sansalvadorimonas verongulae TaxID=2172824 RepID=UPI0012BBB12F|nr:ankyrin repeat domain-containing protein [Sansalvadorimonas verongulae]
MLRINERQRFLYTSFFLLALGFCANVLAKGECKADLSVELKNEYDEHDFLAACREGNAEAVEYFLDQEGFDINQQLPCKTYCEPVHALFVAAEVGRVEVVQRLIAADAEINQTWRGTTPLFMAAQNGHGRVVETIANTRGVSVNKRHSDGATALFMACQEGHADIVDTLLEAGADPTIEWYYWMFCTKSPLTIAQNQRELLPCSDPKRLQYDRIIASLKEAKKKYGKRRQTSKKLRGKALTGEPQAIEMTTTSVNTGMSKLSLQSTSEKEL